MNLPSEIAIMGVVSDFQIDKSMTFHLNPISIHIYDCLCTYNPASQAAINENAKLHGDVATSNPARRPLCFMARSSMGFLYTCGGEQKQTRSVLAQVFEI